MTPPPTFPALPGVLRRCSPVIVHDSGERSHGPALPPEDIRGAIISDWWEEPDHRDDETGAVYPTGGWLVALEDGDRTSEWSKEVPAWTLSLDLSDPTGEAHLRDWLAGILVRTRGRRWRTVQATWVAVYGSWRLYARSGSFGCEEFAFTAGDVPGLKMKMTPAEALRLCALLVAQERKLLP